MAKIKDIPKVDRPREKFLKKGPAALSKSELLAILLGSGIKGKNVQQLSQQIIKKFGKNFLDITVSELKKIEGIGEAKALQIVSAVSLIKRFCDEDKETKTVIKNPQDVASITYDLREKRREYLVCLYLNAQNVLLKKMIISIGLADKTLLHPREIFYPATVLNAASVILVHNHPSGDPTPSTKDSQIVEKITQAGQLMGIPIVDFVIVSEKGFHSFYETLNGQNMPTDYVADGDQGTLFDLLGADKPTYGIKAEKIKETYFRISPIKKSHFQLHNRRYIGSKYKLTEWIFSILNKEKCKGKVFTDIFAGTGVVAAAAGKYFDKIILNDFLYSNEVIYKSFFSNEKWDAEKINSIIKEYNNLSGEDINENYFSINFGGKFFSQNSAKIIGYIRESIEQNKESMTEREYNMLLSSLLYSVDKIANTVGHYDAYFRGRHVVDSFFMKPIDPVKVNEVSIFREDANLLVKQIKTDVAYIDPPYNSRQYSRFYHILETLTKWDSPNLYGVALKPTPENMSDYCRVSAKERFVELINSINARHIIVSYNNTYDSKSNSSKNKIALSDIEKILNKRGKTKIFEKDYRHFNAGNTDFNNHKEYLFVTSSAS